jgi:hypothetical protein
MMAPSFYRTSLKAVGEILDGIKVGTVRGIGLSAGTRALQAVCYGGEEPITRTANLSSALASGKPESFFGGKKGKRTLMIVSCVHGAEMESIAAVLNLINVLETGKDLRGQPWGAITELAQDLRIIIVPVANPDGRARVPADDPTRWSNAEMEKYRHGLWEDGSEITWPACKAWHPMPRGRVSFLGGYFNDRGVNPTHGVFLDPALAPETHALLGLASEEAPDCVLDLHSCGSGPFMIVGGGFIPESYRRRQYYIDGVYRSALAGRNLRPKPWAVEGSEQALTLNDAYFHVCHALPLLFEGAYGAYKDNIQTPGEIVDTYLTMFEAVMGVGKREGFKP